MPIRFCSSVLSFLRQSLPMIVLGTAAAACSSLTVAAPAAQGSIGAPAAPTTPLVISSQGSFFVGGREVTSDTLSLSPKIDPHGTVTVDQMYVHYQIPQHPRRHAIVLVHGCCLTGASWETTPDGRMGWDEYFVRKGYGTYVIDQSGRGRSATNISPINAAKMGKEPASALPDLFAAGHEGAWPLFRIGPKYPDAYPDTQFPVQAGEKLWQQMVPDWQAALPNPNPTVPNLVTLAQQLKDTVLLSHSASGIYPFQAVMQSRQGISAIIAMEPAECPKPETAGAYAGIPILVVFGDHVQESPRWAPRLAACGVFIDALNKAGGKGRLMSLPAMGIKGNSHMIMQDRNNLQVADLILDWIGSTTPAH